MATNTYVALASTTLSVNTTTVTLSSIPQGYTDLILVMQPASSSGTNGIRMRMNGDANAYYSATYMGGNGSSALSRRETASANMQISSYMGIDTTLGKQVYTLHFMNYSNTTTYKTVLIRNSAGSAAAEAAVGLWTSTAAITSLSFNINTFGASTGDFITGSTFSLYGVAAASVGAKATGGTIYSDASYYYHVFTGSGTFTPSQSLSCDTLIVAGGGGGGARVGGGGGAGGYRLLSGVSATATPYTITVGAGGAGQVYGGSAGTNGGTSTALGNSASGGGWGGDYTGGANTGHSGGSGGGANGNSSSAGGSGNTGSYSPVEGYAGGNSTFVPAQAGAGGGGGAGGVGVAGASGVAGNGGPGVAVSATWLAATGIGYNGYIAGGGGGGTESGYTPGVAGIGGGGTGSSSAIAATSGVVNTGSGGGGGGCCSTNQNGGNGGSGLVIVRYAK